MEDDVNWYAADVATFGDRVAAAREKALIDQEELAKRLGIKLSTLRAWEDDTSEPRANRLATLAGVLGVSMMWLITGEGDGVEPPDSDRPDTKEASDLLLELRDLRADMMRRAEQIGRLEKRLRHILQGEPHE